MVIDYAISTLVTVGLFLISIAAHELGHLLVGRFLGYTSTGVTVGWGPGISFYMKGLPVRVGIIPGGGLRSSSPPPSIGPNYFPKW